MDAIDEQLSLIQPPPGPDTEQEDTQTALQLIPEVTSRIETAQAAALAAKNKSDQTAAEMEELKRKLQEQTEQLDQVLDLLQYAALPWWKKLFTPPPGKK